MKPLLRPALLIVGCLVIVGCGARPSDNTGTTAAGGNDGRGSVGGSSTQPVRGDDAFAREAVERLLDGDVSAEGAFDWENLKVPGADVGASYREMPDDENRRDFRKEFIEKFSESFKKSGASASDLKNWREQSKNADRSTIVADTPSGKTMVVSVSHANGQQKVSEILVR